MAGDALGPAMAQVALQLIAIFGGPATLIQVNKSYIAEQAQQTPSIEKRYPVTLTPPENFEIRSQDRSTVVARGLKTLMAAKGAPSVPVPDNQVIFSGRYYRVVQVNEIRGGVEVACWELVLRQ